MESTIDYKIAIKKYHYKKQFVFNSLDNDREGFIRDGWGDKFIFFSNRIKELIIEPNNIYNKIKEFNKWDSIFPSDNQLNKVKLNQEVIDQIFDEYYFKDITKRAITRISLETFFIISLARS